MVNKEDCIELVKKAHLLGVGEAINLCNESIQRLNEKLKKEIDDREFLEKCTNRQYLEKYPDKIREFEKKYTEKIIDII